MAVFALQKQPFFFVNKLTIKKTLNHKCFKVLFVVSTPDRIRTCDPQLRRLMLYPTELLAQNRIQK